MTVSYMERIPKTTSQSLSRMKRLAMLLGLRTCTVP